MSETTALAVPRMYADHHVTKVRQILQGIKGVEDVWASALDRIIEVTFDPEQTSTAALAQALSAAGYEQRPELASAAPDDLSAWKRSGARMSNTHPADARMAGDFRKY